MQLFLSHYRYKIDKKGRVSVPSSFRAALQAGGEREIYAHPHLELPAYEAGGSGLLNEVEERLSTMKAYSPSREQLALVLLGSGELMKIDREGRISLSEALREQTGIVDEAVFVGLGSRFQLWEPVSFAKEMARARRVAVSMQRSDGAVS